MVNSRRLVRSSKTMNSAMSNINLRDAAYLLKAHGADYAAYAAYAARTGRFVPLFGRLTHQDRR
jgi:hypothetical protein